MEVMTVGCTIHCRSWLVVIALMVGMKALLEPGMSTLYFCKREGNVVRGGDEVVVGGLPNPVSITANICRPRESHHYYNHTFCIIQAYRNDSVHVETRCMKPLEWNSDTRCESRGKAQGVRCVSLHDNNHETEHRDGEVLHVWTGRGASVQDTCPGFKM